MNEADHIKVYMTASSFPRNAKDWRAVFIRQLADALASKNIELTMWSPYGEASPLIHFDLRGGDAAWLSSLMNEGGIAHLLRTNKLKGIWSALVLLARLYSAYRRNKKTDLYHVNWLQNSLTLPNDKKPLLITVLGSDLKLLDLYPVRVAFRRITYKRKVIVCPNAEWMVEPLKTLLGGSIDIREVPLGIDKHWYEVIRRGDRSRPHKWLVVSRLTKSKLGNLFEWAHPIFSSNQADRELHLFGPMQEIIDIPSWVNYHGPATPQQLRDQWFPEATGLITLSQHSEGRPQTILEAMASELPVVASHIPAHSSFLRDGKTGLLCENIEIFNAAIKSLEAEEINVKIGREAKCWVKKEIGDWDDCAERYLGLYRILLTQNK